MHWPHNISTGIYSVDASSTHITQLRQLKTSPDSAKYSVRAERPSPFTLISELRTATVGDEIWRISDCTIDYQSEISWWLKKTGKVIGSAETSHGGREAKFEKICAKKSFCKDCPPPLVIFCIKLLYLFPYMKSKYMNIYSNLPQIVLS